MEYDLNAKVPAIAVFLEDSYGYVYLSKDDLKRFSKYFKISLKNFKDKYYQTTDGFIHSRKTRI